MRIGIDLGGTKIEAAAMNRAGELILTRRVATPADDYRAVITAICGLIGQVEAELGTKAAIGIGMPGALSPATGLVKNSNSTCLNGHKFDRDVEEALGRPVRFANDANCFALSEASDGAAAGAPVAFGVILGTGVGGGVVVGGRLLVGANAIGGEWGHSPLPWPQDDERPGPRCYCGKSGCVEAFLSGRGLSGDHLAVAGVALNPAAIAAAASSGDRAALASLERYADRLARSLAVVVNLIDPDFIVLGGGLGQIERLYTEVPKRWGRYIFSDHIATKLTPPRFGDSSGVRGAAWLWQPDELP